MKEQTETISFEVSVPAARLDYFVRVGTGVLDTVGAEARRVVPNGRLVALVSDANVMPLYGEQVRSGLVRAGFDVLLHSVAPGEATKNSEALLELVGVLMDGGLGRGDLLVALGGGVVGDLAGFAAAVFMRGIPFIQCPTSLLAQVDASIGGKVAIDLPQGKNLMGAFHYPSCVLVDPAVLRSLPEVEVGCGLGEMLKHGLLFSREHTDALLEAADEVYAREPDALARLVAASVELKAVCVARDPRERAPDGRILLNLGHSVGHAIEAAAGFALRHGQAVGLGLRAAARISDRTRTSAGQLEPLVTAALERLRLPTDLDVWLGGERGRMVEQALGHDKKRAASTLAYIALADVAQPRVLSLSPADILRLLRDRESRC
mgnify:CR=1 FL=1